MAEITNSPKPIGRPTKYKEEYCNHLIEHMANGFSFESFAAHCNVNIDTLYEWCKVHEAFSEAKKIGKPKSLYKLEQIGMAGMLGKIKNFNPASWIFTCKNRHPDMFQDKFEMKHEQQKPFILNYKIDEV